MKRFLAFVLVFVLAFGCVALTACEDTDIFSFITSKITGEKDSDNDDNVSKSIEVADVQITVVGEGDWAQWEFVITFTDGTSTTKYVPYQDYVQPHGDDEGGGEDDKDDDDDDVQLMTVSQALSAVANLDVGEFSSVTYTVKGEVTEIGSFGSYYKNVYISDGDNEILIYTMDLANGISSISVGDTIVVTGYIRNYNGTLEFSTNNGTYVYCIQIIDEGGGTTTDTHTHEFATYFAYTKCTHEGCNVIGRKQGESTFRNEFVLTYSQYKDEIYGNYDVLIHVLENPSVLMDSDEFISLYNDFINDLDYVSEQYQIASVLSSVDENYTDDYNELSSVYYDLYEKYCGLYQLVYDSRFCNDFYAGDSDEDIAEYLALSASYSGDYARINNEIDEILAKYYDIDNDKTVSALYQACEDAYQAYEDAYYDYSISADEFEQLYQDYSDAYDAYVAGYAKAVSELYSQFVDLNNQLAGLVKTSGGAQVYDNYMQYSYELEYNREYTPSDVTAMRNYVKTYIAPIYQAFVQECHNQMEYDEYYYEYYWDFGNDSTNEDYYYSFGESIFQDSSYEYFDDTVFAVNNIGNYLNQMNACNVNFGSEAEKLFRTGNYFTGTEETAYTYYINFTNKAGKPIVYFGEDDNCYYQNAFTFVHEFGHYMQEIINGDAAISFDLDETQSQGNEMLFLAWLGRNAGTKYATGYKAVKYDQLLTILETILSSTAVDEFEYAIYNNDCSAYYTTGKGESYWMKNGAINCERYQELYEAILATYDTEDGELAYWYGDYWQYVVFDSACYYISYAVSALPALELFVLEENSQGAGVTAYGKLFDTQSQSLPYTQALTHCGLNNPFEQALYTLVRDYFN